MSIPPHAIAYSTEKDGNYVIHLIFGDDNPVIEGKLQRFYVCANPDELGLAMHELWQEKSNWGGAYEYNQLHTKAGAH